MKVIHCVRHAKSSWVDHTLRDIERPLNKRGLRDAPVMARHLSQQINPVDLMLLSPSKRTRETAEYFKSTIAVLSSKIEDEIYHASCDTLIDIISHIDASVNFALLFGHNPGMTYLFNTFTKNKIDNLPTCGIFRLRIDSANWTDIDTTNTSSDQLIYPKLFL